MGVVALPPQIMLICDKCGVEAGDGMTTWYFDADDVERALNETCFHRLQDGSIACDDCA